MGGGGADVFVWVFLKGDALIHSRKLKGHNFFRKKILKLVCETGIFLIFKNTEIVEN